MLETNADSAAVLKKSKLVESKSLSVNTPLERKKCNLIPSLLITDMHLYSFILFGRQTMIWKFVIILILL